jgi:hypothetical protein
LRFSAFFFGLAASVPLLAHADGPSDADLRSFRASTDKHATLATEGIATPGPWNLQAAHWLVFESASLRMTETNGDVNRVIGPRVLGEPAVSLGLGHRAALGVSLPYVFHQSTGSSSLAAAPPSTGIGDVALHGKASVKEIDADAGGLGFAFLTRVQLPTGDRSSFISDKGAIADLRALIALDYILARVTGVVGYRMRFVHHEVSNVTLGDTIPWGATLSLKPLPAWGLDTKKWLFNLETHGEIGAVPNKLLASSRVSPAFLGLSIRSELAKDLYLFGGAEMGLTDAIGAPLFRGMLTLSYAPTIIDDDRDGVPDDGTDECPGLPEDGQGKKPHDGCPDYEGEETSDITPSTTEPTPLPTPDVAPVASSDADGDGIPDEADKCPNDRETVNGYEDDDGCPELDKDNDTFLDAVDSCPDKPETFNGVNDEDGCPDEAPKVAPLLTETNGTVALSRNIKFDGPTPAKEAASDLRALAAWLINHPGTRLRVAVKPEGKGDAADKLSTTRAISIVEALVRYAHAGGVAEAVAWDAKAKSATNVALSPVALPKSP